MLKCFSRETQKRSHLKRACWVECEFGKFPAIAPDLSGWKREILKDAITETQTDSEAVASHRASQVVDLDIPPLPSSYSPLSDDISSDEMLRQNLDRVLGNLEQNLAQSPNSENSNLGVIHPELEESQKQPELIEPTLQEQILQQDAAPVPQEKRYTPLQLTKTEIIATVSKMRLEGVSQTKIVEQLWQVQKSRSGWSSAYREFRGLGF